MDDSNKHPTIYQFSVDNKPSEQREPFITGAKIKVLVSPRLFDVPCWSIEQMGVVNALCAVADYAGSQLSHPGS